MPLRPRQRLPQALIVFDHRYRYCNRPDGVVVRASALQLVNLEFISQVEGTFGYPPMAVRLVGGGATSRQFAFTTGSKSAATFPLA